METITPEREMTVGDLLKELNLEGKYFGILVDGIKTRLSTRTRPLLYCPI
ncbi:MAG: hypothetical protein ACTSP8_01875 [Promethearchaeota archaeon]